MAKSRVATPVPTDWLFHCPDETTTEEIRRRLGDKGEPITEISAAGWHDKADIGDSLCAAYGIPLPHGLNWDGISEYLFEHAWNARRVVGEIIIVRYAHTAPESLLTGLAELARSRIWEITHNWHPAMRLALVYAGWDAPMLAARVFGRKLAFEIYPLPVPSDA